MTLLAEPSGGAVNQGPLIGHDLTSG